MHRLFCFAAAVLLSAGIGHASTVVSVTPTPTTVTTGTNFTVNVDVLTDDSIFGYAFDITYPDTFLTLVGVTEGSSSGCCFDPGDSSTPGLISQVFNLSAGGPFPSGTLFTLEFTATGLGTGQITAGNFSFSDDNFNTIEVSQSNPADVASVPEPSTMLSLPLVGIWMWRRSRRQDRGILK